MCLPNFIEFKKIRKNEPLIGYRSWSNLIRDNSLVLKSINQNYEWKSNEGPHKLTKENSGNLLL